MAVSVPAMRPCAASRTGQPAPARPGLAQPTALARAGAGGDAGAVVVEVTAMLSFLVWVLLLVLCWPLALLALVLYPLVWLLLLPFRLVGLTFSALFEFLRALLFLPARLLGGRPA
jgi:hypothetical protein